MNEQEHKKVGGGPIDTEAARKASERLGSFLAGLREQKIESTLEDVRKRWTSSVRELVVLEMENDNLRKKLEEMGSRAAADRFVPRTLAPNATALAAALRTEVKRIDEFVAAVTSPSLVDGPGGNLIGLAETAGRIRRIADLLVDYSAPPPPVIAKEEAPGAPGRKNLALGTGPVRVERFARTLDEQQGILNGIEFDLRSLSRRQNRVYLDHSVKVSISGKDLEEADRGVDPLSLRIENLYLQARFATDRDLLDIFEWGTVVETKVERRGPMPVYGDGELPGDPGDPGAGGQLMMVPETSGIADKPGRLDIEADLAKVASWEAEKQAAAEKELAAEVERERRAGVAKTLAGIAAANKKLREGGLDPTAFREALWTPYNDPRVAKSHEALTGAESSKPTSEAGAGASVAHAAPEASQGAASQGAAETSERIHKRMGSDFQALGFALRQIKQASEELRRILDKPRGYAGSVLGHAVGTIDLDEVRRAKLEVDRIYQRQAEGFCVAMRVAKEANKMDEELRELRELRTLDALEAIREQDKPSQGDGLS